MKNIVIYVGFGRQLQKPEARPDLEAHRKASGEFPQVVQGVVSIIGRKLPAYIASVKDTRAIDRWLHQNATPQRDVERRLRLAYHVTGMLAQYDSPLLYRRGSSV